MDLTDIRIDPTRIPDEDREALIKDFLDAYLAYISTPEGRAEIDRRTKKPRP